MPEQEVIEPEVSITETVQRVFGMLVRHRWWILTAMCVVSLTGIGVILRLPNRYSSEAILIVVQQQVPQRYVESLNVMTISEELNALTREVLSRAKLLEIIDAFRLYPEQRKTMTPEQLAELMRKDVLVEPLVGTNRLELNAFRVSFTAGNARLAQEVTTRLTSLFIEEDLKAQGGQVAATTRFLAEQLAAAKQRLDQQEQRLRDFKVSNLGTLPEQQQANLTTLTDLRIQLQNVAGALQRSQQQRSYLESYLNGHVARLQSEKSMLLRRYTAQHPEVVKKDQAIERATGLIRRLNGGAAEPEKPQNSAVLDDPVIAQLQGQVEANLAEIANAPREEQRLRAEIAQYQSRLNLTPVREQQLAALTRDYEMYKKDYTGLVDKQLGSQMAANLEEKQQGRHYRLIDPPTMPRIPSSPKRLKLSAGAVAAGLFIGFALAFLRDMLDRSFHTEKEIREYFQAPLVVGLPMLLTPQEERGRKWIRVIEWITASAMIMAVVAAELYVLQLG